MRGAFCKIRKVFVWPAFFSFAIHRVSHIFSQAFRRKKSKADLVRSFYDGKKFKRFIHIRRKYFKVNTPAFFNLNRYAINILCIRVEERCHKRIRIMRFQKRGLIRNHCVAGCMRFIETVCGEFFKLLENFLGSFLRHAVSYRTIDKFQPQLSHEFCVFLSHGFAKRVSLTRGKPRHVFCHLHHLLLIHRNTVGFFQRTFCELMHETDFFPPFFSGDKGLDKLHRPRTIQSHHGDDVFNFCRS